MHGVRLSWDQLPDEVRTWVGRELGSPVVQAVTQPGGFSPGTADRVVTADGGRAFVKAVSTQQNPDTPGLHRREVEVLGTLTGLASVPQLLGSYDDGTWVAVMIEDVEGRHPSLPWTDAELDGIFVALAELRTVPAPVSWPRLEEELVGEFGCWGRVVADPPADLDPWVAARLERLDALARWTLPRLAGDEVTHSDLRADNILIEPDGVVRVVDWPWASRGVTWFDAALLLVNARWSGTEGVERHLDTVLGLGATEQDVIGVIAGLTGFWTHAARTPAAPGLPTLRDFQRAHGVAGVELLRALDA